MRLLIVAMALFSLTGVFPMGSKALDQGHDCRLEDELFCAIANGDSSRIVSLLDAGTSPNKVGLVGGYADAIQTSNRPFPGYLPLEFSVQKFNQKAVSLLLAHGANPNAIDPLGFSPLAMAAEKGEEDVVKELFAYHADPNVVSDKLDYSPLMWAVDGPDGSPQDGPRNSQTQLRIVRLLISAGANVSYAASGTDGPNDPQKGQTAMDRAFFAGDFRIARALHAAGASLGRKSLP